MTFVGYLKLDAASSPDVLSALERAQARSIRMRDANVLIAKWGHFSARPALEQLGLSRDEVLRLTIDPDSLGYTVHELLAADASVRRLTALLASLTSNLTQLVPIHDGDRIPSATRRPVPLHKT